MVSHTGSVYHRKDGKWCAALQVLGKRKVAYANSDDGARRQLARLQREYAVTGTLPDSGRHTFQNLIDDWLEAATLRPRTKTDYRALACRYVLPVFGQVKLSRLEPVHLQRLYADLQAKGLGRVPSQVHRLLHRAFHIAVLWGWLPHNSADRVLPPTYTSPRREVWNAEDLRRFLGSTSSHRLNPLWTLLAATGMRLGEAQGLRWEDLDSSSSTLTVNRTLYRLKGKWTTAEPKTQAGRRVIELPPGATAAVRRQRLQQNEWRLRAGSGWHETGLVFTTSTGQPLAGDFVARSLRRSCQRAGVVPLTPHGFRHSSASLLIASGVSVSTVAARLGHATPAITTRIYAHAVRGADQQAAQTMQQILAVEL